MDKKADLILLSDSIFSPEKEQPFSGYVAIAADLIIAIAEGKELDPNLLKPETKIIDLHDQTITPGFADVHCFFSGYVVRFLGTDLSSCQNYDEVLRLIDKTRDPFFAHGLKFHLETSILDQCFPDNSVILFEEGCESCSMNKRAIDQFRFTPETCYPEAYVRIFPYFLSDEGFIRPQFKAYMKMLNERGVTATKEMGFDDFYGFTDILNDLEKNDELSLRVSFMSQPVAKDPDFEYGRKMKELYHSNMLRFSGYNQMTDGSVSQYCADLKQPYEGKDFTCDQDIDWDKLKADTLKADELGFRFSLHAQGDGAIGKVVDIYEQCRKYENGKLVNRHAITDLEFSDPQDLERMGKLGVIAEIYPQIQAIADRQGKLAMIEEKIGLDRGKYYWNRRKMADSGVTISCGTDLPLLIDDIPESIYNAVGGYFPEGGEPYNQENMLTITELLRAWTSGGAYNLGLEELCGSLEPGKKADVVVFNNNLFTTPLEKIREVKVAMTIFNGQLIYKEGE